MTNWKEEFEKLNPQFYPGSSRRIGEVKPAPPTDWDTNPKIFKYKGVDTEFFTSGQLAMALGRKAVTIRKWEREGIIPVAMYRKKGKGGDQRGNRRFYSRAQVEGMIDIARDEGLLEGDQRSVKATNFTDRVIELFRRGN